MGEPMIARTGAEARVGESGRTMRIMLSDTMRQRVLDAPRTVIVRSVPWELFDEQSARATSERNHDQTIERISERGGFDASEAVGVLTGMGLGQVRILREDHAHRILYAMTALYRRGVLAARSIPPAGDPGEGVKASEGGAP